MVASRKRAAGRNPRTGFTIIEALIAFAIVSLTAGTVTSLFFWSLAQQDVRYRHLLLTEFASSILEEYAVTYPLKPASETLDGGWVYKVTETPTVPDKVIILKDQIRYVELAATVWNDTNPDLVVELKTLLALRALP